MKSEHAGADVLIVGAGFSGTMAAAQLVARGLTAVLVEGEGRAGQGVAYATREAVHLLNVPAAKMSAWRDAPDDFFVASGQAPASFAPRRAFGAYLRGILDQAVADGVELVAATAVAAVRVGERWRITLDDGRTIAARALVLAQGNQPPEPLRAGAGIDPARFIHNPWSAKAHAAIEHVASKGGDVLIIGTGLTMIDTALSLEAAGYERRIVAVSRRGQIPRAHDAHEPAPVDRSEVPRELGRLMPWLRARSARLGWRGAVDALRPHAQDLWRGFDLAEQRRFLRHARPYWDVHRHRIAPQVAAQLQRMIDAGRLEIVAGRIGTVVAGAGGQLEVAIERRGRVAALPIEGGGSPPAAARRTFAAVFNCTGPLGSMGRTSDALLRQMIDDRTIAVDRLGIGIAVDQASLAGPGVWALGPLTKGEFWEIVAVPDIRGQVAQVAEDIAREIKS